MNLTRDATVTLVEHSNQMAKLRAELTRADLRDQFAMAALTGWLIRDGDLDDKMGVYCYKLADLMLAAR